MITAILHDVVEDTDWAIEKLRAKGFSEEVLEAIECVLISVKFFYRKLRTISVFVPCLSFLIQRYKFRGIKTMCETDEYDELEIETIAAAQLYDDDIDCDDERQIDEYSDCGIVEHHYHNSGCGCLTFISAALSMALAAALLVLAF